MILFRDGRGLERNTTPWERAPPADSSDWSSLLGASSVMRRHHIRKKRGSPRSHPKNRADRVMRKMDRSKRRQQKSRRRGKGTQVGKISCLAAYEARPGHALETRMHSLRPVRQQCSPTAISEKNHSKLGSYTKSARAASSGICEKLAASEEVASIARRLIRPLKRDVKLVGSNQWAIISAPHSAQGERPKSNQNDSYFFSFFSSFFRWEMLSMVISKCSMMIPVYRWMFRLI